MEVIEIERAIIDLRQAVKVQPNADTAERATASEYQMIINSLEAILAEVKAPNPNIEWLNTLQKDVQRILKTIAHRTKGQLEEAARRVTAGESLEGLFSSQKNLVAVRTIADELSKQIVAVVNRRTAAPSGATEGTDIAGVDSLQPTDDDGAMSTPTQSEIDLKIENIQLRMDGRLSSIEGKMDALAAQVSGSERAMALLAERAVAAAESAGNLKQTLWVTSITTILAVLGIALAAYFGTQASNIGIVGSTISAFEAGRAAGAPAAPSAPAPSTPAAK